MKRISGASLVLIVVIAGLAMPATSEDPATTSHAPWLPQPDLPPSQFEQGWNLRIPVTITEDRFHHAGAPVQVHLDLARSLIEGGWPQGGGVPRSFMAYPKSIRLVEYTEGWETILQGPNGAEVPFLLHTTWLEPDQSDSPYEKTQTGPYQGQRNPVVTLEWRLTRPLPPGETHHYFVYFDVEQNAGPTGQHRKQAPTPSQQGQEHLDGLYWVGAGTTLHGHYVPVNSNQPGLIITATQDDTDVGVYAYRGASSARLDERQGGPTPTFTLDSGEMRVYPLGFTETHYRIEATRPVTVLSQDPGLATTHVPEFVPSHEGGLLGWNFSVPPVTNGVFAIVPPGQEDTTVCLDQQCSPFPAPRSQPQSASFSISGSGPSHVTATGDPVLVQFRPDLSPTEAHPAQAASLQGSPVGATFHVSTLSENCPNINPSSVRGGFGMTAWDDTTYVQVLRGGSSVYGQPAHVAAPPDPPTHLSGNRLTPTSCTSPIQAHTAPYTVQTASQTGATPGSIQLRVGRFQAQGGPPPDVSQTTPFGGRHGMDFQLQGPFVAYTFYPSTRLEVVHHWDGDRVEEHSVGPADVPVEFPLGLRSLTSLHADKPISVFPLGQPVGHARFHAAKPDFLVPTILPGEYRGYLFEVGPRDGVDPVFLNGLPGESLTVQVEARNLARWSRGQPLQDSLHFEAVAESENWAGAGGVPVRFAETDMTLPDDATTPNRVEIDLPDDIPSDTQLNVKVRASSAGNPLMTQEFTIVILVRQTFGVETWFGEPTSVSGPNETSLRLQNGENRPVPFVIKNTGSGIDHFNLTFGQPEGGWTASITDLDGRPLKRVESLAPGAQVGALLHVEAPHTKGLAAVTVPVDAVSDASPLATDKLLLSARLALLQGVELEADNLSRVIEPGGSERFTVDVVNTGDDGLSLLLELQADLPTGWTLSFDGAGDPAQGPLALLPGQHVSVPLVVTTPVAAPANQVVSFLLRAEGLGDGVEARDAISLTAIVGQVHGFDIIPPSAMPARPGEVLSFSVTAENTGNGPDFVEILPLSLPSGWGLARHNGTHVLWPGDSATVAVEIDVPAHEPPGPVELVLQVRGGGRAFAFTVSAVVEEIHVLSWRSVQQIHAQPGDTPEVILSLENLGNVPERARLHATGAWVTHLSETGLDIPPGTLRTVILRWGIPPDARDGVGSLHLTARAESGSSETLELPVRVVTPRLEADEALHTHAPRGPGSVGTIIAVLHNPGEIPVRDVEVRLVAGEQATMLDKVRFQSIGPNGTAVAPLRWTEDTGTTPERIEWGHWRGEEFRLLGSQTVPASSLESGDDRGIPLTPLVALLALAAAIALRRRGGAP